MEIIPFQVFFDKRFPQNTKTPSGLRGMRMTLNSLEFQPNIVITFAQLFVLSETQTTWLANNSNGPYHYDKIKRIYFENGMAALLFYLQFYDEIV